MSTSLTESIRSLRPSSPWPPTKRSPGVGFHPGDLFYRIPAINPRVGELAGQRSVSGEVESRADRYSNEGPFASIAPRVHPELARLGRQCARKRVARLMRSAGLVGVHAGRRWRHLAPTASRLCCYGSGRVRRRCAPAQACRLSADTAENSSLRQVPGYTGDRGRTHSCRNALLEPASGRTFGARVLRASSLDPCVGVTARKRRLGPVVVMDTLSMTRYVIRRRSHQEVGEEVARWRNVRVRDLIPIFGSADSEA